MKIEISRPERCQARVECTELSRAQSRFLPAKYALDITIQCGNFADTNSDHTSDFITGNKGRTLPEEVTAEKRDKFVSNAEAVLAVHCAVCPNRQLPA